MGCCLRARCTEYCQYFCSATLNILNQRKPITIFSPTFVDCDNCFHWFVSDSVMFQTLNFTLFLSLSPWTQSTIAARSQKLHRYRNSRMWLKMIRQEEGHTAAPDLRLPRPHSDPSCVILSTEVGHWWQLGGRAHHYTVHQYTIVHCTVQYRGKARPWPWLRTGPSRSGRLETGVSVSSRARPSLWLPGSRRL